METMSCGRGDINREWKNPVTLPTQQPIQAHIPGWENMPDDVKHALAEMIRGLDVALTKQGFYKEKYHQAVRDAKGYLCQACGCKLDELDDAEYCEGCKEEERYGTRMSTQLL